MRLKGRGRTARQGAFEVLGAPGEATGKIAVQELRDDELQAQGVGGQREGVSGQREGADGRPEDAGVGLDATLATQGVASKPKRACSFLAAAFVVFLLGCILVPGGMFTANTANNSLAQWLALGAQNISDVCAYVLGQGNPNSIGFVVNRYLVLAFAGAALGMSGAVYQGSLKNALASPTTLGVMSGATCGATVYALFFVTNSADVSVSDASDAIASVNGLSFLQYLVSLQGQALCTLAGAMVVVTFVVGVAYVAGRGHVSGLALIITGQVVMGVLGGINTLIRYYMAYTAPDSPQSYAMRYLQNGALDAQYTLYSVIAIGVPVLACFAVIMLLRDKVNLLAFDEAEAWTMGVNVNRLRFGIVALTTLLTAVVVSFCGAIGFIGFFVPHLARRIVGPNFRYLLPASALVGASFLMLAYFLSSQIGLAVSSAIGIFTSIIGGAVFIAICIKERGRRHDGWI